MAVSRESLLLLESVPALAGASDQCRRRLVDDSSTVELRSGETLVAEGEASDAAYLVLSGLLEVVAGHSEAQLRILGRGAFVGELGVFTDRPHSASVVALRPSTVLRVPGASMIEIVAAEPSLALGVIGSLARQLAESRSLATVQPLKRDRVALIDSTGQMAAVLARVVDGVADLVPTEVVRVTDQMPADPAGPGGARRVVYVVDQPEPEASRLASRLADRALVLTQGTAPASPPGAATWAGHEAVAIGHVGDSDLADAVAVHRLSGPDDSEGIARLSRRVGGRAVGLALSAGGARAFAHIGVMAELERAGVVIDRVAACSMGAWVGSLYAAGHSPDDVQARFHELDLLAVFFEHGPDAVGVGAQMLAALCNELVRDFTLVSTDLVEARLVVHKGDDLATQLAASMALPGVLSPGVVDGAVHVDGALINPLPVDLLFAESDGPIVAVDVNSREMRVGRWADRVLREGVTADTTADVAVQAMDVASVERVAYCRSLADLVIDPDVPFGTLAYDKLDEIVEAGKAATRTALAELDDRGRQALGI